MSTKWISATGTEYTIHIDSELMFKIEQETGVDLFEMPEEDKESAAVLQLTLKPKKLMEVLGCVHEHCQRRLDKDVTFEAFLKEISGNGFKNSFAAFKKELARFFREEIGQSAMAEMIDQSWEVMQSAMRASVSEIRKVAIEQINAANAKFNEPA